MTIAKGDPRNRPTGYANPTSFRYRGTVQGKPAPDPDWQLRAVVECLAGPLDDDWMSTHQALIARLTTSDPQFQYNPRTKAGKALLSDLVASQGHSDG